ncbi:outer membrane usher protein [Klebsiella aerogenes]|nr:outer membrane usher protein [Klebsiella aerogenes]HEO1675224.1 outer membrane usher protein [Klebsiella aerogenes]
MLLSTKLRGPRLSRMATWLAFSLLGCAFTASADGIEFNTDILDVHDKANIDLSRFSQAGYVMPGKYVMTLRVNKDDIPDQDVEWVAPDNDPKGSVPCLTPALVGLLGVKEDVRPKLTWFHQGQCLELSSLPGTEARGDLSASVLYLNVPQAWLDYRAPDWDPPSLWDNGVPGILMDYYLSGQSQHDERAGSSRTLSGNGTVGFNAGAWRLRADWQGNMRQGREQRSSSWDWSRYYAYRALPSLGAKLTLGESSLYSDIFDSFRFAGASLISDDNMLPPNLRGYAPEVSGIAKTNAKVVISQQGRVLQETQVAAGPFRIQDLNTMVSGALDVRVEEQDGTVQHFTVNTASVPYLTRPGQVRYKLAAGRPSDYRHHTNGPAFSLGEFSWGVNNGWSLYGGGNVGPDYNALALGIGRDLLMFGAMSFDMTHSRANLPGESHVQQGNSFRLSYSKRFDETGSQVTFAGYRFSERNFMSMSEFLDARRYGFREGSSKEMYTVTLNQQFSAARLSAYMNYNHQTYWDRPASDRYTLTLSSFFDVGTWRNLSLSASAYRSQYYDTTDDGMYLSLSVPWGDTGTLGYNATVNRDDNTHEVTWYDRLGDHDNYQLSTGVSRQGGTARGYWTHDGDIARVNANASYQAGRYSALSLSLQGGMTATAQGAALHRGSSMGGTRMLLDTGDVAGIPVKGYGSNTRTNAFGKAVVTDMSSYYRNRVSIDLDALPDNAEAARSVAQATLTEGAIGYRKFDVVSGARAMATVRFADGSFPPFGAQIQNARGQNTGIVGDEGSVYLSGIRPGETMQVHWGDNQQCALPMPTQLPTNLSQGLLLPCHIPGSRDVTANHEPNPQTSYKTGDIK